jgi:hypothetical protein
MYVHMNIDRKLLRNTPMFSAAQASTSLDLQQEPYHTSYHVVLPDSTDHHIVRRKITLSTARLMSTVKPHLPQEVIRAQKIIVENLYQYRVAGALHVELKRLIPHGIQRFLDCFGRFAVAVESDFCEGI